MLQLAAAEAQAVVAAAPAAGGDGLTAGTCEFVTVRWRRWWWWRWGLQRCRGEPGDRAAPPWGSCGLAALAAPHTSAWRSAESGAGWGWCPAAMGGAGGLGGRRHSSNCRRRRWPAPQRTGWQRRRGFGGQPAAAAVDRAWASGSTASPKTDLIARLRAVTSARRRWRAGRAGGGAKPAAAGAAGNDDRCTHALVPALPLLAAGAATGCPTSTLVSGRSATAETTTGAARSTKASSIHSQYVNDERVGCGVRCDAVFPTAERTVRCESSARCADRELSGARGWRGRCMRAERADRVRLPCAMRGHAEGAALPGRRDRRQTPRRPAMRAASARPASRVARRCAYRRVVHTSATLRSKVRSWRVSCPDRMAARRPAPACSCARMGSSASVGRHSRRAAMAETMTATASSTKASATSPAATQAQRTAAPAARLALHPARTCKPTAWPVRCVECRSEARRLVDRDGIAADGFYASAQQPRPLVGADAIATASRTRLPSWCSCRRPATTPGGTGPTRRYAA